MVLFGKAVQMGIKWGPKLLSAVGGLEEINRRGPDAPGKAAALARGVAGQLRSAQAKQSGPGRVRHVLEIVREGIDAMEHDRPGDEEFAARALVWRRRAADAETALKVAASQTGKRRREHLAVIKKRADDLAIEVLGELGAVAESTATAALEPASDEAPNDKEPDRRA